MPDYLDILAKDAAKSVKVGYYETSAEVSSSRGSLKESIMKCRKAPIIAEIKYASPSEGTLGRHDHVTKIAADIEEAGVAAISILTEPTHFAGDIRYVSQVRRRVKAPILMKDIILSLVQIEAASRLGANAVLLIQTLFERGYCQEDNEAMIEYAHSKSLEVLLETHTEEEFLSALDTQADMIGINNRNLKTLEVDLSVTKQILAKHTFEGEMIVSESGIKTPADIRFLRAYGAQAFLVGTSIMKASNPKEKTKELVEAL